MSLKSGTMANWNRDFGGSSEEDFSGTTSTSSTSSNLALDNLSCQPGEQGSIAASHSSGSQRPQSATHTSSTSTESTGSEGISHTPCDGSVWGHPPHGSASQAHADNTASASGLNDPILEHFASCTPPASASALSSGQIGQTSSLSSSAGGARSTLSDETDPCGTEVNLGLGRGLLTPATSEASQDAGNNLGLDPDDNEQAAGIADRVAFRGLELPEEYRNFPFFGDANHENDTASLEEAINKILNENNNPQARADAKSWVLGANDGRQPIFDGFALAPSPGPAYHAYRMQQRTYAWRHQEVQRYRREPTFRIFQQPQIYPALGCGTYSPETYVSAFHPSFLVSHLSPSSVSCLSDELYAPADLLHNKEYRVGFNLGIGPPIDLDVCAFTPRDRNALRSYQQQKGKEKLKVQDSLPITTNLLSIELLAEEIDTWLDGIIDSGSGLPEYMDLIMRRQEHDYYSQFLEGLCSWYMESKNMLPDAAHQILRTAFKLLITTTLLSLVPKLTPLPDDLLDYLSSQAPPQAGTPPSITAPRLLTRQIKASIYHLQQQFLGDLFDQFTCAMKLPADVKLALAVLVAYVLDLVKNAGRSFAKHAGTFGPSLSVPKQDVLEYETNVQARLFDQVRGSICDVVGKMGGLAEKLRSMRSILKGKGKQNDDYRFMSVILGTAL